MAKAKAKAKAPPFGAIHRHGFVRVAAASPRRLGRRRRLQRRADAGAGAARPTRAASTSPSSPSSTSPPTRSTTCFLQDAFLDAVEAGIARLARGERRSSGRCWSSARRCGATAGSTIARLAHRARRDPRRRAQKLSCPITANITRSAGSRSGVGLDGLKIEVAGQGAPFGTGPDLRRRRPRRLRLPHRDLRGLSGRRCRPRRIGALAGRADPHQPLGLEHHHRQGRRAQAALRQPGEPLPRRLRLLRRRAGREHHRPRLGRPGLDLRARRAARRDRPLRPRRRARGRRRRRPAAAARADAQRHLQRQCPRRRPSRDALPHASASSTSRTSPTSASSATLRRFPYVPNRPEQLDQDCYEAFNIQVQGLVRRFEATGGKHLVIGVSGGLDSTHALIVAAKACDDSACRARRSSASPCPASPPARRPRPMPGR